MTAFFQNIFNSYLRPLLKKDRPPPVRSSSKEKLPSLDQLPQQQQQQQQQPITNSSSVFEPYFLKIQNILIWENPLVSLITIVGINILFWLIVSFGISFYTIIFGSILWAFLYDDWIKRISMNIFPMNISVQAFNCDQPEYNPNMISFSEFNQYISNSQVWIKGNYNRLKKMREEHPGLFCATFCFLFFLLSVIGRNVSGLTLTYGLLMFVLIMPGIIFHLPITRINHAWLQKHTHDTDSEVEEYLPEATGEALAFLQLAGNAQIKDDDSRESTTHGSSDLAGLGSFSTEFVSLASLEGSIDGLDLDLELTNPPPSEARLLDPEISESDSDEEITGMKFQTRHFNGDATSSSEDEADAFSNGLTFTQHSTQTTQSHEHQQREQPQLLATVTSSGALNFARGFASRMGQTLVTSVLAVQDSSQAETPSKESSSESGDDFEMISTDDLLS